MHFLSDLSTDIIGLLIILGVLVLAHEWGHYAAAKLFGVRVEVFSLGFGKRLWGFKRGDTDYRVSALPFGGYVRMSGENPMEEHAGEPYEFMSHPRWQRFIIALAGPFMNVLLCIAVLTGVDMVHYEDLVFLKQPTVIGWVEPNSPAAKAGLQGGDRVIQIEDAKNPTWEITFEKFSVGAGAPVHLKVQRESQVFPAQLQLNNISGEHLGILPDQPYIITRIEPDLPAAKAGIRLGDEVLSVDGIPVRSTPALSGYLQQTQGKPVGMKVKRDGAVLDFTLTPEMKDVGGESRYRVGIVSDPVRIERLPFASALSHSLEDTKRGAFQIVDVLQRLIRHKTSIKQMSSVIGIGQVSGEAVREGPLPFLNILAIISLNLGIFNLLPIPVLDGGLILLLLIEGTMRRDIKREVKEMVYQVAIVFLILFAVIVIYNDITKTALGKLLHLG